MEQQLWFSSDWHLGHESILRHTARGQLFDNIHQHDVWLIDTINTFVKPRDILYLLGDISLYDKWHTGMHLNRLRCHNLHLVLGNHDHHLRDFYPDSGLFKSVQDRMFFKHYGHKLFLDHYPSAEWAEAHHGSFMLHGHTHGSFPYENRGLDQYRIMDVGWDASALVDTGYGYHPDAARYKPFSLDYIKSKLDGRPKLPHHGYTKDGDDGSQR